MKFTDNFNIWAGNDTLLANSVYSFREKRYLAGGVPLNKAELVGQIAEKAKMTKKETEPVLNALFKTIEGSLQVGEKVQLVGFGTFEVRDRGMRKGRNPQTGAEIEIPASKIPAFKAGKGLKDAVV